MTYNTGETNPNYKHGMYRTPEYRARVNMIDRCYNIVHYNFHNYGARGIIVCDRWLDSLETFIEDMGLRPSSKHSLDRIDNDGDYTPENCKWSTAKEQVNNRRPHKNPAQHGTLSGYVSLKCRKTCCRIPALEYERARNIRLKTQRMKENYCG